jgi:hypothetical protein
MVEATGRTYGIALQRAPPTIQDTMLLSQSLFEILEEKGLVTSAEATEGQPKT